MEAESVDWEQKYGDIVWAKFGKEWWPAYVINPYYLNPKDEAYKPGILAVGKKYTVIFLGDKTRYFNPPGNLKEYTDQLRIMYKDQKISAKYKDAFLESIKIADKVSKLPKEVRMKEIFPETESNGDEEETKTEVDGSTHGFVNDEVDDVNVVKSKSNRGRKKKGVVTEVAEEILLDNPDSFELPFNFTEEEVEKINVTNDGTADHQDSKKKKKGQKNIEEDEEFSEEDAMEEEEELGEDDISNASEDFKLQKRNSRGKNTNSSNSSSKRGRKRKSRVNFEDEEDDIVDEDDRDEPKLKRKRGRPPSTTPNKSKNENKRASIEKQETATPTNRFEKETALDRLQRLSIILKSTASDAYYDEERALKTMEKIRNIGCPLEELKKSEVIKLIMDLRGHNKLKIKEKANEIRLYWKQHYSGNNSNTNASNTTSVQPSNDPHKVVGPSSQASGSRLNRPTEIPNVIRENMYRRRAVKLLSASLGEDLSLALQLESSVYKILNQNETKDHGDSTLIAPGYFEFITRISFALQSKDADSVKEKLLKSVNEQNDVESSLQTYINIYFPLYSLSQTTSLSNEGPSTDSFHLTVEPIDTIFFFEAFQTIIEKMDDNSDEVTFTPDTVDPVCTNAIEMILKDKEYKEHLVQIWVDEICSKIMRDLVDMNKPFKYLISCMIMQRNGAGVHLGHSCYWDGANDNTVVVRWPTARNSNARMVCIVTVFGIAF